MYCPVRLIAGTANECTPYGKLALVEKTVWVPRSTTTPTCEIFDRWKLSVNPLRAFAWVLSSVSSGGVLKYVSKCSAVVQ